MSKKVYILGAGFSYPANMPMQKDLLKSVLEFNPDIINQNAIQLSSSKRRLKNFLSIFGNKDVDKIDVIEDLFTILDKAYLNEENFQQYTWQDLYDVRKGLIDLIIATIDNSQSMITSNIEAYKKFINYLDSTRTILNYEHSLIILNWDTLFETVFSKFTNDVFIDYCFYTYGLTKEHTPHIHLKPSGKQNLKVLKLHGSINWLVCSNCGRIYVDDVSNIAKDNIKCRYCTVNEDTKYYLQPLIITPTLLKQLNSLHIKSTWSNAFIELQEADEIIFIGYSLPKADFELMYLLKKSLYYYDKIKVVLAPSDAPKGNKKSQVHQRYINLFGDKVEFYFDGFGKWVDTLNNEGSK